MGAAKAQSKAGPDGVVPSGQPSLATRRREPSGRPTAPTTGTSMATGEPTAQAICCVCPTGHAGGKPRHRRCRDCIRHADGQARGSPLAKAHRAEHCVLGHASAWTSHVSSRRTHVTVRCAGTSALSHWARPLLGAPTGWSLGNVANYCAHAQMEAWQSQYSYQRIANSSTVCVAHSSTVR